MKNQTIRTCSIALALLCLPAIAAAQVGCVNSPENPTVVLALVGGAACCWRSLRSRIAQNRRK